jgi:hypothetical protein
MNRTFTNRKTPPTPILLSVGGAFPMWLVRDSNYFTCTCSERLNGPLTSNSVHISILPYLLLHIKIHQITWSQAQISAHLKVHEQSETKLGICLD